MQHPGRTPRRRALAVALPTAAVVLIAAVATTWVLIQPETESSQPAGRTPVTFLGNSFTGGWLSDSGPHYRWPAIVSKRLDLSDTVITSDGSGYVTGGVGFADYGDLADDVASDASVVVVLGSDDDANHSFASIKKAALETYATIERCAPHARILAIATFWVDAMPPKGIITSRDAVRAAATEAHVSFADPIAERWLVDDPSKTIGPDGLHPTNAGQAELAERIEPLLNEVLALPVPSPSAHR